jgi:hypothetical protein
MVDISRSFIICESNRRSHNPFTSEKLRLGPGGEPTGGNGAD